MPWAEILAEYARVLRRPERHCPPYHVNLAFEFLGFGWSSVRTPRAAFEILQKVDRENVGLAIDAAHFFSGGGLMREFDQLDPKRIFAFHLDDLEDTPKEAITRRDPPASRAGGGATGRDLLPAASRGYDGSCSIELFRPEYWNWDPLELATKARQAALKILSPYFQIE